MRAKTQLGVGAPYGRGELLRQVVETKVAAGQVLSVDREHQVEVVDREGLLSAEVQGVARGVEGRLARTVDQVLGGSGRGDRAAGVRRKASQHRRQVAELAVICMQILEVGVYDRVRSDQVLTFDFDALVGRAANVLGYVVFVAESVIAEIVDLLVAVFPQKKLEIQLESIVEEAVLAAECIGGDVFRLVGLVATRQ